MERLPRTKLIRIEVENKKILRAQLEVMNGVFKLTKKELDVLESLIEFDPVNAATTQSRKYTREKLGFNSSMTLNNVIHALKAKKVLIPNNPSGYKYHSSIPTTGTLQLITFQFNTTDDE